MSERGSNWEAEVRAKAQEAIDHLRGTCEPLYQNFEEYQDEQLFCDLLDDAIFECTCCGWWCEQPAEDNPETGEWICDECLRDMKGDEDDG